MKSRYGVPFACLTILVVLGCGGDPKKPDTSPVSGTVTLDGKPLAGAVVAFYDVAGKSNPGTGTTDEAGKYTVGFATNRGIIPGSYKVIISHYVGLDGSPLKLEEGMDVEQLLMQEKAKNSLPEAFTSIDATSLKAEVKSGQSHTFDWKLKSDGTVAP